MGLIKNKNSVVYTWLLSYICVLLVPIFIGTYLYYHTYHVVRSATEEVYNSALSQTSLELDNHVREVNAILGQLLVDEDVQRLSSVKGEITGNGQLWVVSLTSRIQQIVLNHPNIEDIYILFGESGSVVSKKGHMSDELFGELYYSADDREDMISALHEGLYTSGNAMKAVNKDGRNKLLFPRTSLNTGLGHNTATLVVQIDEARLMDGLFQNEDTPFFVLDDENNVIAATTDFADMYMLSDLELTDEFVLTEAGGRKWEAVSRDSSEVDWHYVYMISTDIYESSAKDIQIKTIIGLVIGLAIGLVISLWLARRNYHPVRSLLDIFDGDTAGNGSGEKIGNEYQRIEKLVQNVYHESKIKNHELFENMQALKNFYVYSVLMGSAVTEQLHNELSRYGLDFSGSKSTVVLFTNPYYREGETLSVEDEKNFELLQSVIVNIFEEIAGEHFGTVSTTIGINAVSIITLSDEMANAADEDNWNDILCSDIRLLQEKIDEYLHLGVNAAIGNLHIEQEGIHFAYLEAKEAIEFVSSGSDTAEIVNYNEIYDKRGNYSITAEAESLLIQYVSVGNSEGAQSIIDEIISFNQDELKASMGAKRYLYMELAMDIVRGGRVSQIDGFTDDDFIAIKDSLDKCLDIHLKNILNKTCDKINGQKREHSANERFCREVKEYIAKEYTNPDLNISQAALHFDITPSYLSSIFKKETGKSLLSYISEIRTDAAKELLKGDATIADVAVAVGFRDSAALIRTFKKNVGLTPGQFREENTN